MKLSERATNYFRKLKRREEYALSREKTVEYCRKQDFPLTDVLLDVQTNFSGYKLTIRNDDGHGFLLCLFGKFDFDENREIEYYYFGETYVVDFGAHDTAQFHFFITNSGELCTLGQDDGDTPNIICSSIETYIEQYAIKDELAAKARNPYYYKVLNNDALSKLFEEDFTRIVECSDKYSEWVTNGELTIEKGTLLGKPEFYFHVYGQTRELCDNLVNELKHSKIIA